MHKYLLYITLCFVSLFSCSKQELADERNADFEPVAESVEETYEENSVENASPAVSEDASELTDTIVKEEYNFSVKEQKLQEIIDLIHIIQKDTTPETIKEIAVEQIKSYFSDAKLSETFLLQFESQGDISYKQANTPNNFFIESSGSPIFEITFSNTKTESDTISLNNIKIEKLEVK